MKISMLLLVFAVSAKIIGPASADENIVGILQRSVDLQDQIIAVQKHEIDTLQKTIVTLQERISILNAERNQPTGPGYTHWHWGRPQYTDPDDELKATGEGAGGGSGRIATPQCQISPGDPPCLEHIP